MIAVRNAVCFTCQRSGRGHLCPRCGSPLTDIGTRLRTPRTGDDRAWTELRRLARTWLDQPTTEDTHAAIPRHHTRREPPPRLKGPCPR